MWGLVWIGVGLIVLEAITGNLATDEREARHNDDKTASSGHKHRKAK